MLTSDFDFELPERLIAQTPTADRGASRLLVLHRSTGAVEHRMFRDLAEYLRPGDTLVLNDTRVIPARLLGRKADTGAKVEMLLLVRLEGDRWEALAKPARKIRRGARLLFGEGDDAATADGKPLLTAVVEEEREAGLRVVRFEYDGVFQELLDRAGQVPLPPYIREKLSDPERYQTVYARHAGSAAAPTAGLHFTDEYLKGLQEKGIRLCRVTLHVGLGTFRPVTAERVADHRMHAEWYSVREEAARLLSETRSGGGRIVAVGTTSARTLETLALRFPDGNIEPCSGWTDIFIYPGHAFRLVDALITNFHLPRSTLIMLVSAFAGREAVLAAYREAVRREYRFFSFGDAMLIF
jgi:S-adenosylmethionine:tRNA ribosyltransferase-isomerase